MKFKMSSGLASRTIIILAVVVLLMAGLVYGVTRYTFNKKSISTLPNTVEIPQPVYQASVGDIQFTFTNVKSFGKVLSGKISRFPNYQTDLVTTEKFLKVTVQAENTGKINTIQYAWDLGNIIDSDGRIFSPINDKAYSWLPSPDLCGFVLKPGFAPTPCVKYYEVAKISTGLKLEVMAQTPKSSKMQNTLLDLNITQ